MIEANDIRYYGVLIDVCVLTYSESMPVILFKCQWYDERTMKKDENGFISVNTSTDRHKQNPFCLALMAKQVYYIDDPKSGS